MIEGEFDFQSDDRVVHYHTPAGYLNLLRKSQEKVTFEGSFGRLLIFIATTYQAQSKDTSMLVGGKRARTKVGASVK